MPYTVRKHEGGYRVTSPHGIKAKHTTKEKAEAQARLLRGVKHGMKPRGSEYSNKHAGEHCMKEAVGVIISGTHKAAH